MLVEDARQIRVDLALVEIVETFSVLVQFLRERDAHKAPVPRLEHEVSVAFGIGKHEAVLVRVVVEP